jgi:hypothetical protein
MKSGSFPDTIARQEVEAVDAGEWKPVPLAPNQTSVA